MRRSSRLLSILLRGALCGALLPAQLGCSLTGNGTPADQLANANYEISGFIGDAQNAILQALKLRILKPEQALAAGGGVQKLNLAQRKELEQLVARLRDKGGKEELVISEGDKGLLIELVNLMSDTASEIVNDPAIVELDSSTRATVTAAILAIKPIASRLLTLIQRVPAQQKVAPPLREQLRQATQKSEVARAINDRRFAELQAEVPR